jgi:uncharacterized protein (DUF305 family)
LGPSWAQLRAHRAREDAVKLAQAIKDGQTAEIKTMESLLAKL